MYRNLVPWYSHIAAAFNNFLHRDQALKLSVFNEEQMSSFNTRIEKVTIPKLLALPKAGLPYSVDTDSSDYQVGCSLFRTDPDGTRKSLGYWIRSILESEVHHSSAEK